MHCVAASGTATHGHVLSSGVRGSVVILGLGDLGVVLAFRKKAVGLSKLPDDLLRRVLPSFQLGSSCPRVGR